MCSGLLNRCIRCRCQPAYRGKSFRGAKPSTVLPDRTQPLRRSQETPSPATYRLLGRRCCRGRPAPASRAAGGLHLGIECAAGTCARRCGSPATGMRNASVCEGPVRRLRLIRLCRAPHSRIKRSHCGGSMNARRELRTGMPTVQRSEDLCAQSKRLCMGNSAPPAVQDR